MFLLIGYSPLSKFVLLAVHNTKIEMNPSPKKQGTASFPHSPTGSDGPCSMNGPSPSDPGRVVMMTSSPVPDDCSPRKESGHMVTPEKVASYWMMDKNNKSQGEEGSWFDDSSSFDVKEFAEQLSHEISDLYSDIPKGATVQSLLQSRPEWCLATRERLSRNKYVYVLFDIKSHAISIGFDGQHKIVGEHTSTTDNCLFAVVLLPKTLPDGRRRAFVRNLFSACKGVRNPEKTTEVAQNLARKMKIHETFTHLYCLLAVTDKYKSPAWDFMTQEDPSSDISSSLQLCDSASQSMLEDKPHYDSNGKGVVDIKGVDRGGSHPAARVKMVPNPGSYHPKFNLPEQEKPKPYQIIVDPDKAKTEDAKAKFVEKACLDVQQEGQQDTRRSIDSDGSKHVPRYLHKHVQFEVKKEVTGVILPDGAKSCSYAVGRETPYDLEKVGVTCKDNAAAFQGGEYHESAFQGGEYHESEFIGESLGDINLEIAKKKYKIVAWDLLQSKSRLPDGALFPKAGKSSRVIAFQNPVNRSDYSICVDLESNLAVKKGMEPLAMWYPLATTDGATAWLFRDKLHAHAITTGGQSEDFVKGGAVLMEDFASAGKMPVNGYLFSCNPAVQELFFPNLGNKTHEALSHVFTNTCTEPEKLRGKDYLIVLEGTDFPYPSYAHVCREVGPFVRHFNAAKMEEGVPGPFRVKAWMFGFAESGGALRAVNSLDRSLKRIEDFEGKPYPYSSSYYLIRALTNIGLNMKEANPRLRGFCRKFRKNWCVPRPVPEALSPRASALVDLTCKRKLASAFGSEAPCGVAACKMKQAALTITSARGHGLCKMKQVPQIAKSAPEQRECDGYTRITPSKDPLLGIGVQTEDTIILLPPATPDAETQRILAEESVQTQSHLIKKVQAKVITAESIFLQNDGHASQDLYDWVLSELHPDAKDLLGESNGGHIVPFKKAFYTMTDGAREMNRDDFSEGLRLVVYQLLMNYPHFRSAKK